jgi:precorrin-2/cobalt-factor-2 C20-methyltransferase
MTSKIYPLLGVGLGPGDPELISVKGLKALQHADVIYYPASSVSENRTISYSQKIIEQYQLDVPCVPLHFPMGGENRERFYQKGWETLKSDLQKGLKVVMVSEGDPLFYSTFGYILRLAQADGFECQLVPGIPAFFHASSIFQTPLVDENRSVKVMARPESFDAINKALSDNEVVVVMKMSILKDWYTYLKDIDRPFFYIEKAGTSEQYVTNNAIDLKNREIPYFSLIIFQ